MRILFVNPPALPDGRYIEAEDCCWGAGPKRVLPAMLLAAASEAQRAGHDVALVDLSIEPRPALAGDLIVYPLAWQYHRETHAAMAQHTGRAATLVLAVPAGYAWDYAQLDPPPFAVAYSEPEAVLKALPLDKAALDDWRRTAPGLVWRDRLGVLHKSDRLPNCLASLGPVDYGLVPGTYWRHYHVLVYQVTRGCPYRCGFCTWGGSTVTARNFRTRDAVQVATDLHRLRAQYAGRHIPLAYLLAAQLSGALRWVREFHAAMQAQPVSFQSNVNLHELARPDGPEIMLLLRGSGMVSASAGLEATSDALLARLGKPHPLEQAIAGIKVLVASGVPFRLHVRSGYGETAAEVTAAIAGLHQIKAAVGDAPLRMDLGPIIHYQGTAFYDQDEYRTIPHPAYPVECRYMADIPHAAWREYAAVMREYGWLARGVGGK